MGYREAFPILIKGLHRLEYRGYDSAGVALIDKTGDLNVYKTKGKVANLEKYCEDKDVCGTIGIAHTRWATHGEPSERNAHPHYSQSGNIAIIHNGIIENYLHLKELLKSNGFTFKSDTDTEVLVQLIEYMKQKDACSLYEAVRKALSLVVGAYAIGVLERDNPDVLIAAKQSSPLVIGVGEGEFFLGSDASPIIEFTKDVVYVNDGEIVKLERNKPMELSNLTNERLKPNIQKLKFSLEEIEKGGYPHFMLKEICEQPAALDMCMKGRVNKELKEIKLSGITDNIDRFRSAKRILISACGTSWHAGLIGKYLFETYCRIPVEVEVASEFRYRNPVIFPDDVMIAISQSGETADTLAAIALAKSAGAFTYGVCNVIGSSIARATDTGTYTHAGPEIGVASTKAFTTQVAVLIMIVATVGKELGTIDKAQYEQLIDGLDAASEGIKSILAQAPEIEAMSHVFTYAKNFIYLGRGYNYPVALEGALKLKEISYIHAEGYPAAEMKHGPIALVDDEMPIVVVAPKYAHYDKILSNVQEIKSRNGRIISIVSKGDEKIKALSDYSIEIPETIDAVSPLLTVVPLQLLSYYVAIAKKRDVDQPRNLAKSVTVE